MSELKSGREARLLKKLGISIRLNNGRNCLFYEKKKAPFCTIHSNGMVGVAAAKKDG